MDKKTYKVEKLVEGGAGIVRDGSHTIFVPFVIPGEEIKISIEAGSKSPTRAAAVSIESPSSARVEPRCPIFGRCGGCGFQHIAYGHQLIYKREIMLETFARIAGMEPSIEPVIPSEKEYNYRSRIKLQVRNGGIGFYAERKKEFIKVAHCHLAEETINRNIESVGKLVVNTRQGTLELVMADDRSVTAVLGGGTRRKIFGKTTAGEWKAERGAKMAFAQVNPSQNERLRSLVAKFVSRLKPRGVIELYAGSGNLTEVVAPLCEWINAVDSDASAVSMGKERVGANVEFERCKSGEFVDMAAKEGTKPDLVLLDPPRPGASETISGIARLAPADIIYVSCNPATLARDTRMLADEGYSIKSITPIDMFPQTAHIESVTLLQKDR